MLHPVQVCYRLAITIVAGTSDILWTDTSGDVTVWQMNGATVSQSVGIGDAPVAWTIQSAGAD